MSLIKAGIPHIKLLVPQMGGLFILDVTLSEPPTSAHPYHKSSCISNSHRGVPSLSASDSLLPLQTTAFNRLRHMLIPLTAIPTSFFQNREAIRAGALLEVQ